MRSILVSVMLVKIRELSSEPIEFGHYIQSLLTRPSIS